MFTISHLDKLIKSSQTPIHLVKSIDDNNRKCFFFVMASKLKIRAMQSIKNGMVNLSEYGVIVASGFGHEVPVETKLMLMEKYGFDADSLK